MQYLIWGGTQQANPLGVTHDPRFQTMFHLYLDESWQASSFQATYLIDRLVERRSRGLLATEADKQSVAVLLQNFGGGVPSNQPANLPCGTIAASLYCTTDYLALQDPELRPLQPWCVNARARMKPWTEALMTDFFAQRGAMADPIPVPAFWILDSESPLSIAYGNGGKTMLLAARADPRWTSIHVPGFGAQTMAQLYETERTRADTQWNADITQELQSPLVIENDQRLRDVFTWYGTVCTKARDAIYNECFYQPIRDAYAARGLPLPAMANYEDLATDGAVDTFGWMADRQPTDLVWYDSRTPLTSLTKTYTRGRIDGSAQGHSQNIQYANQRWACIEGTALAGLSAPLVYPVGGRHLGGDDLYRLGHPDETPWRIAMRLARHDFDSVINSGGGDNAPFVMPWLWGWGQEGYGTYSDTILGDDEWIPTILLCRAKGVTKAQVWYPLFTVQADYPTDDGQWYPIRQVHHRVFSPQLTSYAVTLGTEVTVNRVGRLTRTLRRPLWVAYEDEYLDRVKINPDTVGLSTTNIEFTGVTFREPLTNFCAGSGRVFIEGVLPAGASARIEILNRNTNKWVAMAPSGVVTAPGWFGAYTPDGDFREEARASVPPRGRFVSATGQVSIRVVMKHGGVQPAWLDLVQYVTAYDGVLCGGGEGGSGASGGEFIQITQADASKDDCVDADDALRFLGLWGEGSPGADHTNDGVVDADDLAEFSADFAEEVAP